MFVTQDDVILLMYRLFLLSKTVIELSNWRSFFKYFNTDGLT